MGDNGWFLIDFSKLRLLLDKMPLLIKIFLRFDTDGLYCVTKGNIFSVSEFDFCDDLFNCIVDCLGSLVRVIAS